MTAIVARAELAFAGRVAELDLLTTRLEVAVNGRGGVAMLAGEPGIGKTRLAEELAAAAHHRHMQVRWGRCHEGEGAPAFWPWLEVLRHTATHPPDAAPGAMLPELDAWQGDAAVAPEGVPGPVADPALARFRLFDRITAHLGATAQHAPLLIILEDLHWADTSSLLLLQFLAQRLRELRVLVLGTYRDVEVDRNHPLATTLATLNRDRDHLHIELRGLSPEATASLLRDVPSTFAATLPALLHRSTGGNPLFMREMLRHLGETGRLTGTTAPALADVPDGVRWVIRQRLARLSPGVERVLQAAAVIGASFDMVTLTGMFEGQSLMLLEALDEAERARLVSAGDGLALTYQFTHDLIRETVYTDLGRSARIRLHQQAGAVLERRWGVERDAHLEELAYHFLRAAPGGVAEQAVAYARRAAQRSFHGYAFDEAVHWYEQALDALTLLPPDNGERRCDLLLGLGDTLLMTGNPLRAVDEVAPAALAIAENLGADGHLRAQHACQLALEGLMRRDGPGTTVTLPVFRRWVDLADRYTPPASAARVRVEIALAAAVSGEALHETLARYRHALSMARDLGDTETYFFAATTLVNWGGGARHQAERRRLVDEVLTHPRDGVNPGTYARVCWRAASVLFDWGEPDRAEAVQRSITSTTAEIKDPELDLYAVMHAAYMAVVEGRLQDALADLEHLIERAAAAGRHAFGVRYALRLRERPLLLLGPEVELPPVLASLEGVQLPGDVWIPGNSAGTALRRAAAGDPEPGRDLLATHLTRLRAEPDEDANFPWHLLTLLELAVLLQDRDACADLAVRLAPMAGCFTADWGLTATARHLGDAMALLGERAKARAYYEQALAGARTIGFRPEIALTSLSIARLFLENGDDGPQTCNLLTFATSEFAAMRMQPALRQAERLAEQLTPARTTHHPTIPGGLSARELDVLRLIAAGHTNAEIAALLVLSERTVERHAANIYAKLGARGRPDAVAFALRHNLAPA